MAEYVNPQGIEAYIQNEQFSNAVKGSYKNIDLTGKRKRDLERFEAKKKRTAQWLRGKADGRYFWIVLFLLPITVTSPVAQNENHFSWESCPRLLKTHIQFWIFP